MNNILVRQARHIDIPRLVEMERIIWQSEEIETLGSEVFEAWLETHPDGFFVGEQDGLVVSAVYAQAIKYDPTEVPTWKTFDEATDYWLTRRTHDSNGNRHFVLTVSTTVKGGGNPVMQAMVDFSTQMNRPAIGVSRLPGLNAWLATPEVLSSRAPTHELVHHYLVSSVLSKGGKLDDRLLDGYNSAIYPPVHKPDWLIAHYIGLNLVRFEHLLPNFWDDKKSANYTALFTVSRNHP